MRPRAASRGKAPPGRRAALLLLLAAPFLTGLAFQGGEVGQATAGARIETAQSLVVVVNEARPETDLSRAELRRIYLGEQRFWRDGTAVHGVLPPREHPELLEAFLDRVLGMTEDEFWRRWKSNVFRGLNHRRPRALATTPVTLRAVFRSPILIALVPADALPERSPHLRVLTVGGASHDEDGYPLRFPTTAPRRTAAARPDGPGSPGAGP